MDLYSCTLKRKILFRGKPITQTWHIVIREVDATRAAATAEMHKPKREPYVIEDWPTAPIVMKPYSDPTRSRDGSSGIVSTWLDPDPRNLE